MEASFLVNIHPLHVMGIATIAIAPPGHGKMST